MLVPLPVFAACRDEPGSRQQATGNRQQARWLNWKIALCGPEKEQGVTYSEGQEVEKINAHISPTNRYRERDCNISPFDRPT
jgi:hypothetical protein